MAEVHKALALSLLDISRFNGLSFRIGAATTAAQTGCTRLHDKMYGRWQSHAYLNYLRIPTSMLAEIAIRLSAH